MGIETKNAIINEKSYELNFTNEGGIEGTTRFLKNICGMWIYERCRKEWKDEAAANQKDMKCLGYAELIAEAMKQPAFQSIINPDDACFANPSSMVEAIKQYCEKTDQHVPQNYGEFCRCIFESRAPLSSDFHLAEGFCRLRPQRAPHHRWRFAQSISQPVYCRQLRCHRSRGPQEGTAIGNIMLQAKASGMVKDIWEMRQIIANSLELKKFEPQDKEAWDAAYENSWRLQNKLEISK